LHSESRPVRVESESTGVVMVNPAKKSSFVPPSDMTRVLHTAMTRADPALAWKIFVDSLRWNEFTDLYGRLTWIEGKPWAVGSRLRMELLRPARIIINRLITLSRPGEQIAWIDHSRRSTVEQWVTFAVESDGRTAVHILSQVVGAQPKVAGQSFTEFLKANVSRWFDAFCVECDRVHADTQSKSTISGNS